MVPRGLPDRGPDWQSESPVSGRRDRRDPAFWAGLDAST